MQPGRQTAQAQPLQALAEQPSTTSAVAAHRRRPDSQNVRTSGAGLPRDEEPIPAHSHASSAKTAGDQAWKPGPESYRISLNSAGRPPVQPHKAAAEFPPGPPQSQCGSCRSGHDWTFVTARKTCNNANTALQIDDTIGTTCGWSGGTDGRSRRAATVAPDGDLLRMVGGRGKPSTPSAQSARRKNLSTFSR